MPETPLKWWKPHSVLSCCRGSQVKLPVFRVIPIKGASVYGKPVASMPRKRNKNGVYLTEIGTDTAKEQIYNRFTLTPEGDEPLPGAVHFPNNPDIFDLTEAQQLTAEEQVEKWVDGRKKILWDSKKRRNEALDCFVYALPKELGYALKQQLRIVIKR